MHYPAPAGNCPSTDNTESDHDELVARRTPRSILPFIGRGCRLIPDEHLGCRGTSPCNNKKRVRNLDGQTYATTIDKQGATRTATPTAPKPNLID